MAQRAKCSFMYERGDGGFGFVAVGDVLPDDHEAVAGRGMFFFSSSVPSLLSDSDPFAEDEEEEEEEEPEERLTPRTVRRKS